MTVVDCTHEESRYGRCVSCGRTWDQQARDRGEAPMLTRETIHFINEHYRLGDASDEAYFYSHEDEEADLEAQSKMFRAKVTDEQLNAYLDAMIRPPHAVGQDEHDAMVNAYFAELAR